MRRILLAAVLTGSLFTGCTTYCRITNVERPDQETIFRDGRKVTLSDKTHTVTIGLASDRIPLGARAVFVVAVKNGSDADILFSTEDIVAHVETDGESEATALRVFSYDELVAEEERRQVVAAFAAGLQSLSDSMNTANAGHSYTYGTYSGYARSPYGSAYGYGRYSGTTYSPAAAQAARNAAAARSQARMTEMEAQEQANMQFLSTILKKQTVFPGEWHGGLVEIQMPRLTEQGVEFTVDVKPGGEIHTFRFRQENDRPQ